METYPHNLIEQYLKASSKFKKFERMLFKRFAAPNVSEQLLDEFTRLGAKFEEAGADQYAAMCHIAYAKICAGGGGGGGNAITECNAYLKAARAFLHANSTLHFRTNRGEYKEGALRCYIHALERCPDDGVLQAAIIREMIPLQQHYESTSTFASPAHRIYELEVAAHACLERCDFLTALRNLDDIVDNIYERKQPSLYEDLLRRVEVLRLLLLIALNLPPARQSPSHIKLIEFYYTLGTFEDTNDVFPNSTTLIATNSPNRSGNSGANSISSMNAPGTFISDEMKYALAEIVMMWCEYKPTDLKLALEQFALDFISLNEAQRFVLKSICKNC